MEFEWDPLKAFFNEWKHGVSFEEAKTAFADPLAIAQPDDLHSGDEERFIRIGTSSEERLLIVAYAIRGENARIISCREATPGERRRYENYAG